MTKYSNILLTISLNILNLLDIFFTFYAIKYDNAKELNPIIKLLINCGDYYFIVIKTLWILIISVFLYLLSLKDEGKELSSLALKSTNIFYGIVVLYEIITWII